MVVLVVTGLWSPGGRVVGVILPKVNGAASVVVGRAGFVKENVCLGCSPNAGKAEAELTLLHIVAPSVNVRR